MRPRIVFIHTVTGLEQAFAELCRDRIPDAQLSHIADESLIQQVLAAGGLTPAVYRRMCDHVVAAEQNGANAIQLTCSSVSPCVDIARHLVAVPVLKIDEPIVDQLVRKYDRIGVIATAPTTLKPTGDLLREKARFHRREVELQTVLCEGAYDAFFAGDMDRHDEIVRTHLRELMPEVDVVLLAQASMARVADTLARDEKPVPILSSPRPAIEHLAKLIIPAEPRTQ